MEMPCCWSSISVKIMRKKYNMSNLYCLFLLLKNMYIIYYNIYFIHIIQPSFDGHYNKTRFSECVCVLFISIGIILHDYYILFFPRFYCMKR